MRKIQLGGLILALVFSGAQAASIPCNGFEIKVKNDTSDDLLVNKIQLKGADIRPDNLQKLGSKGEQSFTINNSEDGKDMEGKFELHSISLPSKKVTIVFTLKNKKLVCVHDDKGSEGDYSVDKTRLPNHVNYTIK